MDDEPLNESGEGLRPDAPGDLESLESMIAADEQAEVAKVASNGADDGQPRDTATGQFTGKGASATLKAGKPGAPRAGERQTPEVISAAAAKAKAGASGQTTGKAQAGQPAAKATQATPAATPAAGKANGEPAEPKAAAETEAGQPEADADAGKSSYRKETERRERGWQELNRQKEEFKAQQAAFELERQTLTAREQTLRSRTEPKLNGHTASEYEAAAPKFEARAQEFERRGEFEQADQQRVLADEARRAATDLRSKSPAAAGVQDIWQKVKTDLPEALNVNSPLNRELRTLIQQRPDLLADDAGPYRVAVLAGRKLVAGLEAEVQKQSALARQVPELQEQVQTLTERIAELEAMTSPAGEGGGGGANRGRSGGRAFAEKSTSEQEAELDRELAGSL